MGLDLDDYYLVEERIEAYKYHLVKKDKKTESKAIKAVKELSDDSGECFQSLTEGKRLGFEIVDIKRANQICTRQALQAAVDWIKAGETKVEAVQGPRKRGRKKKSDTITPTDNGETDNSDNDG